MSPAEKAAQAKLDARVTMAASIFIASITGRSKRRATAEVEPLCVLDVNAERLDDLIIAVRASEALAEVTAEGDAP